MTIWKSALPKVRSSRCPQSRLKVMPTAHRIRSPVPTRRNSQADMSTGPSRAALDTICRRKHRTLLPKRLSTSPKLKWCALGIDQRDAVRLWPEQTFPLRY